MDEPLHSTQKKWGRLSFDSVHRLQLLLRFYVFESNVVKDVCVNRYEVSIRLRVPIRKLPARSQECVITLSSVNIESELIIKSC